MKTILAIGLNPALQKTLVLESLTLGGVNRATKEVVSPGGKSIHFARAANTVFPGSVLPVYFAGGHAGQWVIDTLERLGIESLAVNSRSETRMCTTVLDKSTGNTTELVGLSEPVSQDEAKAMKSRLLSKVPEMAALAFCGTYPEGIDEEFFLELLACHGDRPVLVDAYRGMGKVMLSGKVDFLKINLNEARELTGCQNLNDIAEYCLQTFRLSAMMITDGPRPAYLFTQQQCLEFALECISFVNPIGAGDTCAGVMFSSYLNGYSLEQAFSKGLAAASASCKHLEGALFEVSEMNDLIAGITVSEYQCT